MVRTKMMRKKSSMKTKGRGPRGYSGSTESVASSKSENSNELTTLTNNVYESPSHFYEAYQEFYMRQEENCVKNYEKCVQYVKGVFSNMLMSYPESYLNATIDSTVEEGFLQDQNVNPNTKTSSGHQSRMQSSKREPTEFKKPRTPRKDRKSRKRSLSVPTPSDPLPPPVYKTPLNRQRQQMAMLKSITPKVTNTPLSVMRRPQHGEVAFSSSGSPLLVGAYSCEDIPTVSVPLQDGRVFSILPDPGLPPADLPDFDDNTKQYLKTLREHLAMLSAPSQLEDE